MGQDFRSLSLYISLTTTKVHGKDSPDNSQMEQLLKVANEGAGILFSIYLNIQSNNLN